MDFKTATGGAILDSSVCGAETGSGRIMNSDCGDPGRNEEGRWLLVRSFYSQIDSLFLFFLPKNFVCISNCSIF